MALGPIAAVFARATGDHIGAGRTGSDVPAEPPTGTRLAYRRVVEDDTGEVVVDSGEGELGLVQPEDLGAGWFHRTPDPSAKGMLPRLKPNPVVRTGWLL
jgi:hypothetical protein